MATVCVRQKTTDYKVSINNTWLLSDELRNAYRDSKIGMYARSYVNASNTVGLRSVFFPAKPLTYFRV